MANTEFTISGLIESQLPDFINAKYAENAPSFRRFIELYYEWLENSAAGNTVYHIMSAEKYRDIDETEDSFIEYFKDELLPYFPNRTELEITKILKAAKEFYQKKGTAASIHWLFRVLFNKESKITYPRDQILRASDGKWQRPIALKVSDTPFLVQTTESTQNIYAANGSPTAYFSQNTFSTSAKFINTLRKDSTILAFSSYKIWVQSATDGGTLKTDLLNYINVNPSTAVTDNSNAEFTLIERVISEDLTGYGTNQHGFNIVESYYKQGTAVEDNKIKFFNYMSPTILESVFSSASGSTKFQFDGIQGFEICRLGTNQLIASNGSFDSGVSSVSSTIGIDGANTPCYVFSFAYTNEAIVYPDSVNNVVLANTTYGEGRFALQYNKKFTQQNVTADFTSSAAANVAVMTFAFKEKPEIRIDDLIGRLIIGQTSGARAVVERSFVRIDEYTKTRYIEIFISNVEGEYVNNELIYIDFDDDIYTERILGFVNSITIDPNNRGLKYNQLDPVVIYGGFVDEFGNRPTAGFNYATAVVDDRTAGRVLSVQLLNGGYGYRENPNTSVTVVPDVSDPIIIRDATVEVTSVDTGNAIVLNLATDTIEPYASVTLSTSPFNPSPASWGTGFPIKSDADITSVLADCLDFQTISFYPISGLALTNDGGEGYLREPTLQFETVYPVNGGTASISDLGLIAAIEVVNGGLNYQVGDTLQFAGGGGSGAAATVTAVDAGAITEVTIDSRGYGYTSRPTASVVQTAGGRVGAQFVVYLFNDGVEYDLSVEEVGQILSLRVTNQGFGYISRPSASLKVLDVYTDNLTRVFSIDQELTVYQGADPASATFTSNVDVGYVSSINQAGSANATIRLYEYNGILNLSSPLIIAQTGDHLNLIGSKIYGNGLAKANLRFIDGTTTYSGFYLNTDGFLSSDKKLQDRYKYHNFSYVLESDMQLDAYNQTIKNIVHPAGSQLIAYKRIADTFTVKPTISHGFSRTDRDLLLYENLDFVLLEDSPSDRLRLE